MIKVKRLAILATSLITATLLSVNAVAAPHPANRCSYCSGGSAVQCNGATLKTVSDSAYPGDNPASNYECAICGKTARYWTKLSCSSCKYYYWQEQYDEFSPYTADLVCGSHLSSLIRDWKINHDGTVDGGHDKTDNNGDVQYNACAHGNTSPHNLACSTHTAYSGSTHYYCSQHGWVGTSAYCPGLAVSFSQSSYSVEKGATVTASATASPSTATKSFSSNKTTVFTVGSANGVITGVGAGSGTLTVTATL